MVGGSVAQPMWWVGGSHLHNNATSWPNLQVRTCKNSSQVEFQVGPSVAIYIQCDMKDIYSSNIHLRTADTITEIEEWRERILNERKLNDQIISMLP